MLGTSLQSEPRDLLGENRLIPFHIPKPSLRELELEVGVGGGGVYEGECRQPRKGSRKQWVQLSQEMWDLWPALAINLERRVSDGDSGSVKCLCYNGFCLSLKAGIF